MKKKTPFIVVEGLDGCGKGTQIKLFAERAQREGHEFLLTREPGGAAFSEELRKLFKSELGMQTSALTQFLTMWGSRRNFLEKCVWPSLRKYIPVLSDRGDPATLAYQVYAKQAPELEQEFWRMRQVVFGELSPTLYIFLDVTPKVARERMQKDAARGTLSGFDAAPLDFFERVYEGYLAFGNHPGVKMVTINGMRDAQAIHNEFYEVISKACGW